MIRHLVSKQRAIAWVLFWVLYTGTTLPVMAGPGPLPLPLKGGMGRGAMIVGTPIYNTPAKANPQPLKGRKDAPGIPIAQLYAAPTPLPVENIIPQADVPEEGPGPGQPEMEAFKAVNANDMVDLFSGDFSYNIPLMDVGGYPVNLSYGGGVSMDQEASWVGLGWSVNPGAINRNVRGLPDDFKGGGDQVVKTMSVKENRTVGGEFSGDLEVIGKERKMPQSVYTPNNLTRSRPGTVGLRIGAFYNNYKGWGTEVGMNIGLNAGRAAKSAFTSTISVGNNSQNGFSVNNSFSLRLNKDDRRNTQSLTLSAGYNSRSGLHNLQMSGQMRRSDKAKYSSTPNVNDLRTTTVVAGFDVPITFATPTFTPSIQTPYTSSQFVVRLKAGLEQMAFHPNLAGRFYVNRQYIQEQHKIQKKESYGYLYMQEAGNREDVLLDYNRDKDLPLGKNSVVVGMPGYTNDVFSVSGQGTGGMFKAYRGDIGYVYDHSMRTHSKTEDYSLDLGFGNIFHGGVDIAGVTAWSRSGMWRNSNTLKNVIPFTKTGATHEPVYFKNPGEKGLVDEAFFESVGGDELIRPGLYGSGASPSVAARWDVYRNGRQTGSNYIAEPVQRRQRDKRTQVISYLTAADAAVTGLEKHIRSYSINSFPAASCVTNYEVINRVDDMRQPHHLGEITVLGSNGGRYIYGLPVYNMGQKDVTFAAGTGDATEGLVTYDTTRDNSTRNNKGIDNYFASEYTPPHAHAYLLTGVLSADYVDVTGDGVTDDDMGDAVKMNYSRVYGGANGAFAWRAPYAQAKATYNPGLRTDNRDERGTYAYGDKEVWYLNSIESKNMMATFVIDTENDRRDDYGVKSENGGRSTVQKLYRLKEINLYTKSDYVKNGANAKPIKTVHFEYDYSLCTGNPSSESTYGKLTLRKVWFSYNKNYKGQRNAFKFWYHGNNPTHNTRSNDRWGNYKDQSDNPGSTPLTNADYPYSLQGDSATAAYNAGAWLLDSIQLPSGGRMKVTYEADDYAYVQNKRAMQMCTIAGFGNSPAATPSTNMYSGDVEDYHYVFVSVPRAISNHSNAALAKREIHDKYLEDVPMIYFKLWVKMPDSDNRYGSGYEMVPGYASVEDYGVRSGTSGGQIWIKVKTIKGTRRESLGNTNADRSPFATQAVQFLRHNLPYKAHPNSEIGDRPSAKEMFQTLATVFGNIREAYLGFPSYARMQGWCKTIMTANSFIRLNNPDHKKYGGGHRVKQITIYDNWNNMATGQPQAIYGQRYDYSTTRVINGVDTRISSGVAGYEPMVGNDENPFRVPVNHAIYSEQTYPLAPVDFGYVEAPIGESYFPGASVGYSKITVTSIHNTKKSSNGTSITEFYTAKDFPVKTDFTPLEKGKSRMESQSGLLKLLGWTREMATVSQGFRVELNDMHGRMKAQYVYPQGDPKNPTSYTLNFYKLDNDLAGASLNNTVQVVDSASGNLRTGTIGKDIEVMADFREHESFTFSGNLQLNFDYAQVGIFPVIWPSAIPTPKFEQNRYRVATISKIINRYALLDSVVVNDKGSVATTKNMVYDAETGDVLLTRTNNEFDDPIYNFSYPAHWAYSGMGPAYKNLGAVYTNLVAKKGRLHHKGGPEVAMSSYFESGDEVMVYCRDGVVASPEDDPCAEMDMTYTGGWHTLKLWVLNAAKAREGNPGYFLADAKGKYYTGNIQSLRIIRSGKRNLMATPVGSITSLQSPIQTVGLQQKLVFDDSREVIAAGAAKFKDIWPTENRLKEVDSCVTVIDTVGNFFPARSILAQKIRMPFTGQDEMFNEFDTRIIASYHGIYPGKRSWREHKTRSLIKYDLSAIPAAATILSAQMNFRPVIPYYLWNFSPWDDNSLTYSYDGLPERIDGIVSRYRVMPWNGISKIALWDYDNDVDSRVMSQLTYVPAVGMQEYLNVDVLDLVNELRPLPYDQQTIEVRLRQDYREPGQDFNQQKFMSFKQFSMDGKENFDSTLFISYTVPRTNCFKVCVSELEEADTINPYVYGIWGNWRGDRAYTYYGDRKETDPTAATNIRKDGQIDDFEPYWAFNAGNNPLTPSSDENRWVWNSEIKMVNRKGFDIENRDPLNRYNAGIYGYRQQLPVAVAQNSRQREIAYEGFEDHDYEVDTCLQCRRPLWIDPATVGGTRIANIAHTGRYSLRVNSGQTVTVPVTIVTQDQAALQPNISIAYDTVTYTKTTVNGNGTGLLIRYNQGHSWSGYTEYGAVNKNWGGGSPPTIGDNYFYAEWTGKIQPRYTGVYKFYTRSDDMIKVKVNGVYITKEWLTWQLQDGSNEYACEEIYLVAGQLYDIMVQFTEAEGNAFAYLSWESSLQPKEVVPITQLYPPGTTTATGTVTTTTEECIKPRHPKPENLLLPQFSPINGRKMIFGAWVREGTLCTDQYNNVQVTLSFNDGSSTTKTCKPKGYVIEGWQRIEEVIDIPATGTVMNIQLQTTSGTGYFDDIRLHPFNSNMKSFVYDAVNLRLMAELDENNHAAFYEYDDDGTLIRVKKETERGIKTIQETRSALIKD